jgi:hypothetical protein
MECLIPIPSQIPRIRRDARLPVSGFRADCQAAAGPLRASVGASAFQTAFAERRNKDIMRLATASRQP